MLIGDDFFVSFYNFQFLYLIRFSIGQSVLGIMFQFVMARREKLEISTWNLRRENGR